MNIGIKYCGGCNPRYDRAALLSQLKNEVPDHVYRLWSEGINDVTLVVCGCKRACAKIENEDKTTGIIIDDDSTIESIIDAIHHMKK